MNMRVRRYSKTKRVDANVKHTSDCLSLSFLVTFDERVERREERPDDDVRCNFRGLEHSSSSDLLLLALSLFACGLLVEFSTLPRMRRRREDLSET